MELLYSIKTDQSFLFYTPGLVCHVENIALLVPSHQDFKHTIRSKTVPLQEGTVRLDARFSNEWITDLNRAGFPSFSGISDLECLTDLFGNLTLKEAHFVQEPDLLLLTCKFSTEDNRWVSTQNFSFTYIPVYLCMAIILLPLKLKLSVCWLLGMKRLQSNFCMELSLA